MLLCLILKLVETSALLAVGSGNEINVANFESIFIKSFLISKRWVNDIPWG